MPVIIHIWIIRSNKRSDHNGPQRTAQTRKKVLSGLSRYLTGADHRN